MTVNLEIAFQVKPTHESPLNMLYSKVFTLKDSSVLSATIPKNRDIFAILSISLPCYPFQSFFFNQIFDFTSDLSKSNVLLSLRSFLVISMSWLSESLSFQNSEISQICLTSSEILEAKRNCQIVS